MNNLLAELYFHIFEYLHLEDLANLRLTRRKFNEILYRFRIKELNFYCPTEENENFRRRWFFYKSAN